MKRSSLVKRLGITTRGSGMVDGLWRGDGRLERICAHGIGHTVSTRYASNNNWVHGCDGCCAEWEKDAE